MNIKPYYKSDKSVLYQCDNLELTKQLPDNYIDLIYCDILYNTGRKFDDYDDDLGTSEDAINWYKPRLKEMYRILKETGTIYLHMDHRLSHYIKVEMDKIFNQDNFLNEIIWHYTGIKRSTANKFPQKHDTIFSYVKNNNHKWETQYQPHKKEYLKRFKPDETGRLCRTDVNPTKGGARKIYLDDVEGDIVDSVWEIPTVNPVAKERTGYNTQKPKALIERIIKASSNEGDIVADFFMSSGTTGEVAVELGRKFIGCDIGEKACQISRDRIVGL